MSVGQFDQVSSSSESPSSGVCQADNKKAHPMARQLEAPEPILAEDQDPVPA